MGRIIFGGYGSPVVFNIQDVMCRAIQNSVLDRLLGDKGCFLRVSGELDGKHTQHAIWVSAASPIRFEYDAEITPEVDETLAGLYKEMLEGIGGIILPSDAELEQLEQDQGEVSVGSAG